MSSLIGLACALLLAAIAWRYSRTPGGFYDGTVYAMTPHTHRRYAATGLGFALLFSALLVLHAATVEFFALAALVLTGVFYATSFLRGYADSDE